MPYHHLHSRVFIFVAALLLSPLAAIGDPPEVGAPFPDFSGECLRTGEDFSLSDLKGRVVLIDFWATWCGPCLHELPNVIEVYKQYHDDGLEIVSISLDSDVKRCKKFIEDHKLDWYHICSGKGWKAPLARKHGVRGIPYMAIVGRDGNVVATKLRGDAVGRAVKKALEQKYRPADPQDQAELAEKRFAEVAKLRQEGKLLAAEAALSKILRDFPGTNVGRRAARERRELRNDPQYKALRSLDEQAERERNAEREVNGWLKLARQSVRLGRNDLAIRYYQRIIENYPDTKVAHTAEAELAALRSE